VTAGELKRVDDLAALTRAVEVTLSGSLPTWAFYPQGTAAAWVRHDLGAVLRPYARPAAAPRRGRASS
jgi:hypothetical protein